MQYPKPYRAFLLVAGVHTEPLAMPIDIDKLTEAESSTGAPSPLAQVVNLSRKWPAKATRRALCWHS